MNYIQVKNMIIFARHTFFIMNNEKGPKLRFLICLCECKHNKFMKSALIFFALYFVLILSFLIAEIVLISLDSELLSGYELVLLLNCLYGLLMLIFVIYLITKIKAKIDQSLQIYFFSGSFLFCVMNIGPIGFIAVLILISVVIPGDYGSAGQLTSRLSVYIHEGLILPFWLLMTAWGIFLSFKMIKSNLFLKKQNDKAQQINSFENSEIIDVTNPAQESEASIDQHKPTEQPLPNNPYLGPMKDRNGSNSIIMSEPSQFNAQTLNKLYSENPDQSTRDDSGEINRIGSSFEDAEDAAKNGTSKSAKLSA